MTAKMLIESLNNKHEDPRVNFPRNGQCRILHLCNSICCISVLYVFMHQIQTILSRRISLDNE